MPTKFMLPDYSSKGRKRLINASGGQTISQPNQRSIYAETIVTHGPISKFAQERGMGITMTQPMFFSPMHTPQNWQIASKKKEVSTWCRFYYDNEPKVAAGVDLYSEFPMSPGFKLECPNKKILEYYEEKCEELELIDWCHYISFEYFLLGDVYPFAEISCEHCNGRGFLENGEKCNHPDGTIKRIVVMNPDYIEVQSNYFGEKPIIALIPDEELQMIVKRREPKAIYDKLPKQLVNLVASGRPIPLSDKCISHIKHCASPYATYGTSMLRRLFTVLAYKTKLMTANWIVAERLILPIRVIQIGDKDRPASDDDISSVQAQLSNVANDPNLTIVTHHAFQMEWIGACYDDKTEILTPTGWKLFENVDGNEIVGTFNQNTKEMQWQQIEEYHKYDYDSNIYGGMYHFKHKSVDICVTPNHRMLIERNGKLIEVFSQNVKHNDKLLSSADWIGRIPTNLPYKENEELSHLLLNDYLEFAGYYLSEGGMKRERRNPKLDKQIFGCAVGQNKNSPIYASMKNVVEKVYPNFYEYEDDRHENIYCNFAINNVKIARYIATEFGEICETKQIPRWIRDLPKDKLKIIFDAMMAGDGSIRNDRKTPRYRYQTTSKKLADHFSEIAFKLGYFTTTSIEKRKKAEHNDIYRIGFTERRKETKFTIRKKHIKRVDYFGKVYCVKVPNTWLIIRRNGKIAICGNTGKIHQLTNELEQIGKEILDGLMLNQALLSADAPAYSGTQVGVEIFIKRLETWRSKLKKWIEKRIFEPIAMMQGFVDEKKSEAYGETRWLYPRIKWNDLGLRDKSADLQLRIQLYDKGLHSGQTLCEEFGLDYDTEQQRIREETILAMSTGQLLPNMQQQGGGMGGPGGGGGMPPMGGGGGGPMPPPGGEAGGVPGGGMPGGAGGMPGGGAPAGAPGAAAASASGLKVVKGGNKSKQQQAQTPQTKVMRMTKLEGQMYKMLSSLNVPFSLFGQYTIKLPGHEQPFMLDFAYPQIGIGVETDGKKWHENEDDQLKDKMRDQKLASVGWRILRFKEDAIAEHMDTIKDVIMKNIVDAAKNLKQATENENGILKFASDYYEYDNKFLSLIKSAYVINANDYEYILDETPEKKDNILKFASAIEVVDNINEGNIVMKLENMDNDLGCVFYSGEKA